MKASTRPAMNPLGDVLRGCWPAMAMALIISVGTTILVLVPPLYMINVFDKVLYSQSLSTLVGLSIAAAIAISLFVALDYLRSRIFLKIGSWLGRKLYHELLEPALQRSLRTGAGATETVRDIGELRQFTSGSTIGSCLELLASPLFFIVLLILHPVYLIATLAFAVVMGVLAVVNELLVRKPTVASKFAATSSYGDLGDALRNAETIESMGLMPNVIRRWEASNRGVLDHADLAEERATAIRSITRGVRLVQSMAIIGIGAVLVIAGEATGGSVFAAMIISGRALQPMDAVINGWRQWVSASDAMTRLGRLIDDYNLQIPRSSMALPRPVGALEIDQLTFAIPGARAPILRNVTFDVRPGECIAIVGPSGAGKSTLAKLLVGVWAPTRGSIRLDGHDVFVWDRSDFGQYVGYLPQHVELFSGTVRENIGRLSEASAPKVIEAAKRADVHELIGRFEHGYDTDIGPFGQRLTGGQRQRIGLARAMFGRPALLVLDEPDASLDSEGQSALNRAIEDAKASGNTVILVSHRAGLIKLANRIVLMREGIVDRIVGPEDLVFDDRGLVGIRSLSHLPTVDPGKESEASA